MAFRFSVFALGLLLMLSRPLHIAGGFIMQADLDQASLCVLNVTDHLMGSVPQLCHARVLEVWKGRDEGLEGCTRSHS